MKQDTHPDYHFIEIKMTLWPLLFIAYYIKTLGEPIRFLSGEPILKELEEIWLLRALLGCS